MRKEKVEFVSGHAGAKDRQNGGGGRGARQGRVWSKGFIDAVKA